MDVRKSRFMRPIVAGAALLGPVVIPLIAWASTYTGITYDFDSNLQGPARAFYGNIWSINLNSTWDTTQGYKSAVPYTLPQTFDVYLYRQNSSGIGSTLVGTYQSAPDNGSTTLTWNNTGSGYYFTEFEKPSNTYGYWVQGTAKEWNPDNP